MSNEALKILTDKHAQACKEYKLLLQRLSTDNTIVCGFNHVQIVAQFKVVDDLEKAIDIIKGAQV